MNHAAKNTGFTLIELMLAMTFISVLLLAIALTIIQIGNIYTKGMTLKEVNQVSRDISDDLRRNIAASQGIDLTTQYQTSSAGGRMCLGTYTYIWNTSKALEQSDANRAVYLAVGKQSTPIRFLKVPDASGLYCMVNASGGLAQRDIRTEDTSKTQELLESGDRTLQLHSFAVLPTPASAIDPITAQQLYSIAFAIGTGEVSAMNEDQTACRLPGDPKADPTYCTVQQFRLLIRTGMGGN